MNILLKGKARLNGLDHLRALAIVLVLLFHYKRLYPHPSWIDGIEQLGWTGVDLFFVLSGFLISSQLFKEIKNSNTISLKAFFIKRFFRILPLYYIILAAYFIFPFLREKEALPPLWKFLTFTHNFGSDFPNYGTFFQVWSLCVEEHFYLFFPLLLLLLIKSKGFKKSYWVLLGLFLFGFALRFFLWNTQIQPFGDEGLSNWGAIIYAPTYNRLDGLLVGVAIAAIYQWLPNVWAKITNYANYWLIAGILLMVLAYFFWSDFNNFTTTIFGFPLIAIAYGCMIIGVLSPANFLYRWNSKTTQLIAILSYGIYLSHKAVIVVVQNSVSNLGIAKDSNFMFILCMFLCVVVAWALYLLIEQPFLKLRKRFL